MPNAVVTLQVANQAAQPIRQTADATRALAAEEARAAQASLSRAQAVARLQLALGQNAAAERTLSTALSGVTTQTTGAIRAQIQLIGIQQRGASAASAQAVSQRLAMDAMRASVSPITSVGTATQSAGGYVNAFKGGLAGIVGPAAAAAAGIGLLIGTADSFKEAFSFKTQLDATNTAITSQLKTVRDSTQVFAEGRAFADKYKITQEELTSTLQSSIGVLRASKSSTTDLLTTLSLLQATTPDKPISEAARAMRELASGDVTTIKDLFNIPAAKALAMKNEIAAGGDAVQVLATYLKDSGASMELLEARAKGAVGAMNDLKVAQEDLKLAQAEFAKGPGLIILRAQANIARDAIKLLNGDVRGLNDALKDAGGTAIPSVFGALLTYNTYVLDAGAKALAWAGNVTGLNPLLTDSAGASDAAGAAALYYASGLREIGPAASSAASAIDALNNKKILPHLTDNKNEGAVGGLGDALTKGGNLAAAAAKKTDADAARLQSARDALALARATTSAAKIAELKRQQARASDPVEKLQLQTQIEQERNSAAKSHTGELNKQLNLHESIYDSMAKQRDAALDIEKLAITGRQADRADAQKVKTAQAILAKLVGRTDARSEDARATAQDVIALADVEHRQRANVLDSKGATAGATIVNGKLIQSQPGGATGALPPPPGGAGAVALPPPPGGAQGGAGGTGGGSKVLTLRLVDGANRILAELTEPFLMDAIMRGLDQADVGIGN